jgi:hypothetical protein
VKYASRGSDYSKREVASVLRSIFQNSPHFEEEEKLRSGTENNSLPGDSQFESDLKIIYYPYIRDSRKIQPDASSSTRKASRAEREAYLANLQRVMKKIGEDLVNTRRN